MANFMTGDSYPLCSLPLAFLHSATNPAVYFVVEKDGSGSIAYDEFRKYFVEPPPHLGPWHLTKRVDVSAERCGFFIEFHCSVFLP